MPRTLNLKAATRTTPRTKAETTLRRPLLICLADRLRATPAVRTLDLAIKYANASVSPLTPVYYFLGPGVYDDPADKGSHVFEHPVQIQGWSFIDAEPLTDGRAGGSAPFMGTVNNGEGGVSGAAAGRVSETDLRDTVLDHTRAPLIPTRLFVDAFWQPTAPAFRASNFCI